MHLVHLVQTKKCLHKMNTWWIRKKWETSKTRVQEIKHQKAAARVPAQLHRNSARVKSPEQLINAAEWNLDIDSERSSCCSRSRWENVVESASARHPCTLVQPEPSQIPPDASSVVLVPDIYIYFCSASTVHTAAWPLPLEVVPWRRTQTEAQQTAGRDRPANKGAHCRWTKGLQSRGHSVWCNRWKHAQGVFLWKAKRCVWFFFYAAGCVLSCCAANRAAGLF